VVSGITPEFQLGGDATEYCETADLAMALEHEDIRLSQQYLLSLENDQTPTSVFEDDGELVSNGDPFTSFVGDPDGNQKSTTDYGYGTYAPNIARVATSVGATVLWSGSSISDSQLFTDVGQGHPAVAWVETIPEPASCSSPPPSTSRRLTESRFRTPATGTSTPSS
jgi:uncharacterized protein YvpB